MKCVIIGRLALLRRECMSKLEKRKQIAKDMSKKGYNCCQAVVCAFKDRYDISEENLLKISEGFGGGMGNGSVCGAVAAMVILAGLEKADGNVKGPRSKVDTKKVVLDVQNKFKEKNKSLICRELKGIDTKIILRSCSGCIEDAVEIVNEYAGQE